MQPANSKFKVLMYWGDVLYDSAVFKANESVRIGRGTDNDFIVDPQLHDMKLDQSFELVKLNADGSVDLFFNHKYHGHVKLDNKLVSLHSAIADNKATLATNGQYKLSLAEKTEADIIIGHVSFALGWVDTVENIPRTGLINKNNWRALLIGALILLLLVTPLIFMEPEPKEIPPERLITIESTPKKQIKATAEVPSAQAPSQAAIGERKTKDGGAAKGESGKATIKPSAQQSAVQSLKKSNLGSLVGGLTAAGSNAPSKNTNADAVVGQKEQQGTGGFSTEGLKTGGGGKTVGVGRAVGNGEGGFAGTGRLGLSGNSSVDGIGSGGGGGTTKVAGGLDRDIIESYIRRRLDRIRLCYERQLNFSPKLSGKILVRFAIGKTGQVMSSSIAEDTMKNENVRSCILSEVKSWSFPPPEGGTLVNVDYPFVFESSAKSN